MDLFLPLFNARTSLSSIIDFHECFDFESIKQEFVLKASPLIFFDVEDCESEEDQENEENEEKRVKIAQEIKQLVLPGTMGEVFKVMALSKKQSVKLDGFKELDLKNRL